MIEGEREALHEFPFEKHVVRMVMMKVNTTDPSRPDLTNKHWDTSSIEGTDASTDTEGGTKNLPRRKHENNSLINIYMYVTSMLASTVSLL